jgi:transposase InsO family protein
VISFLNENIITRFAVPDSIVCDNAKYFSSAKLTEFVLEFGIKLKYSTNYYSQGNGLAESTNKNIINIIKKTISQHP